jgi:hypothetical protein
LEELFAQAVDDDERAAVGESLKQLVTTPQVWCTATLRANSRLRRAKKDTPTYLRAEHEQPCKRQR